jgi:lysophospholipase L1-like esterase
MTVLDPVARLADELSPEAHSGRLSLYVALGDSFTAGTGSGDGQAWPELFAESLREQNPSLALRNLAVEGATSAQVVEQLPEAVELEPDLVTVVCGANDVLHSTRPDPVVYASNLALILGRLRVSLPGVRIATATSPERWDFMRLRPRTRQRVERGIEEFNGVTRRLSGLLQIPCLEVSGHPGLADADNFSDDGLHPSPLGHVRAADGFAALLHELQENETTTRRGEA